MVELLVILGMTLSMNAQAQNDEPDLKKERSLHYLYRKYNKSPTPPERWEEVLKKTVDPTYSIQKGDTLWDISNTFFGDPQFWPKIWSLNSDIRNPHEILPKGSIVFTPGSVNQPPALGMKKTDSNEVPAAPGPGEGDLAGAASENAKGDPAPKTPSQTVEIDLDQIKIPPPTRKSEAAIAIPGSIPSYVFNSKKADEATLQVETVPVNRVLSEVPLLVTHYVTDDEPTPIGTVVETETGSFAAGEGALIFVKLPTAQPGQRFLVTRNLGKVKSIDVEAHGFVNQVNAQVEVREQVNPTLGIYRATVIKSVALIELGDFLVAEEIPFSMATPGAAQGSVASQVMGGQYSPVRGLFGDTNVLFLNTGSTQGLTAGMVLPVFRNPKFRTKNSVVELNPIQIGQIQVVRADETSSTAVVLNAVDDIRVGDVTNPSMIK
jgi:hypothetical protein